MEHTKPVLKWKHNPGAPDTKVLAGAASSKVLLWEYIDGPWGWCGSGRGVPRPCQSRFEAGFPGRRSPVVLEGNKSSTGRDEKVEERINVLISRRDPHV